MLVLARKKGEVVRLNDNMKVVVVKILGDKVKLGFDCPDDVTVHRQEVYEAIQRKGQEDE